ncbi:MAG: efflux transporter outer membrane subunit [Proteobacteria bacterium]|nr:efflux transporter outer membrane subunit [Pseudomonadota bacterium]MBU4384757.1 efflux transporter outer membrane subunit [Pseudomonadota bacterium]MBU4606842.1 efflux transporter outer membrane subunit [Pseudomonadota bacterium]MCG2764067.1 efflux transporter outer membrane subunit [Desulfarculaceae bacterium]
METKAHRDPGAHHSAGPNPARARRVGLLCLGLILLSAGCLVGPDFKPPQEAVPAKFSAQPAAQAEQALRDQDLAQWWTIFNDPVLVSLEKRALKANLDLQVAQARLRQARASRGIAAGGLGPELDVSGSYQRTRYSSSSTKSSSSLAGTVGDVYQTGFDASWEVDIFGGLRRNLEAANADVRASEEARRQVMVSLTAEVARNYLELRTLQQRIIIARTNLAAQRHTARLTRQRQEVGFVSGLDTANAEAQASTTAARIPPLEAAARQTIHNLGVLLGQEPAALLPQLTPSEPIPASPPTVPTGLPSDLLTRRPDIRQAEAKLHAATARVGVATADLFPRFLLTGAAGYQSSSFSTWFDGAGNFWSIGPSISWPIFASGKIRANIELKDAQAEEALLVYRQTVLNSLREVEDALVASTQEQSHRRELTAAVAANQKALKLSTLLYTEGQVEFLNVLQAQGALYVTEDALVSSNGAVGTNLVSLYKALGGGWQAEPKTGKPTVPLASSN